MKEKGLWKKVKINVVAKSQIIVRVYLKSIKEQPSGYQMHALSSSVVSPLCGAPALNYARSPHLWSQEGEQKGGEAAFAIHPGHAKLKLSSDSESFNSESITLQPRDHHSWLWNIMCAYSIKNLTFGLLTVIDWRGLFSYGQLKYFERWQSHTVCL